LNDNNRNIILKAVSSTQQHPCYGKTMQGYKKERKKDQGKEDKVLLLFAFLHVPYLLVHSSQFSLSKKHHYSSKSHFWCGRYKCNISYFTPATLPLTLLLLPCLDWMEREKNKKSKM